ncbi:methyl-accepting chemotaxis protein [Marinobacteraceae bacterium S3BR75-40.1]
MSADPHFQLDRQRTTTVAGEQVPVLLNDGVPIDGNYRQVDQFASATGGNATIFVRRGNDFVRVVTSVQKEDGSRAVGTLLSRESPAYQRNIQGEAFNGKVTLFGRRFVTNYTPIKDSSGRVIGIRYIGTEYSASLQNLMAGLAKLRVGSNGYIFILNAADEERRGELVLHPSLEGKSFAEAGFVRTMLTEAKGRIAFAWPQTVDNAEWTAFYQKVPELDWVVAAAIPTRELNAPAQQLATGFVLVTLGLILVAGLIIWVATQRIVRKPLFRAMDNLNAMAEGDYTRELEVTRSDEIGMLQRALREMQRNIKTMIREIHQATAELASASQQLFGSSQQIAEGSREQNEAATTMASTIEELTTNIERLSEGAEEARELSRTSQATAQQGGSVISRADTEMQRIAETVQRSAQDMGELDKLSEQITSIIQVIENIAEQTNLLALNAAIEAARAGDAGRGFAVVADEVRGLAGRTTSSAHEITGMIERMRESTRTAVVAMNKNVEDVQGVASLAQEAGTAIEGIETSATRVVDVFSEISERLHEQSLANGDVAQHVERIAHMADSNDRAVQEAAQASGELESMAGQLREAVARFRV